MLPVSHWTEVQKAAVSAALVSKKICSASERPVFGYPQWITVQQAVVSAALSSNKTSLAYEIVCSSANLGVYGGSFRAAFRSMLRSINCVIASSWPGSAVPRRHFVISSPSGNDDE